jgi:hypothetical protein
MLVDTLDSKDRKGKMMDYKDVENMVIQSKASEGMLKRLSDLHEIPVEILQKGLDEKKDLHKVIASYVFKIPYEKVSQENRDGIKFISFGILYGMKWHII